jgi:hypothetical protein
MEMACTLLEHNYENAAFIVVTPRKTAAGPGDYANEHNFKIYVFFSTEGVWTTAAIERTEAEGKKFKLTIFDGATPSPATLRKVWFGK